MRAKAKTIVKGGVCTTGCNEMYRINTYESLYKCIKSMYHAYESLYKCIKPIPMNLCINVLHQFSLIHSRRQEATPGVM